MAAPYTTYDAVGQAEDVQDVIYDISPVEIPFQTAIGTVSVTAVKHEWQTDALDPPAENAAIEGADAAFGDLTPTVMLDNNAQIFQKTAQVSDTLDAVDKYGRARELAYQVTKRGREITRDIEHAFIGDKTRVKADGSEVAARTCDPYFAFVPAANVDDNGGTPRAFDEAQVLNVLQSTYTLGGDCDVMLVSPNHAIAVANFAYSNDASRNRDYGTGTTVVNAVEIYQSPFGILSVVIDRFIDGTTAIIMDSDYWARGVLRPMRAVEIAKTGDSEKRQVITECTLVGRAPDSSGYVDDLTP